MLTDLITAVITKQCLVCVVKGLYLLICFLFKFQTESTCKSENQVRIDEEIKKIENSSFKLHKLKRKVGTKLLLLKYKF